MSATPAEVYRAFLDAVNRQDLDAAQGCVDVLRYRENCVGFTPGFVDWDAARDAIRAVWVGLPTSTSSCAPSPGTAGPSSRTAP